MPKPSDLDADPHAAGIAFEVVIRITPDVAFPAGAAGQIRSLLTARSGGVVPASVNVGADGVATVVVPDTGVDVGFWVAWTASALAAAGRTGTVQAVGNRARVT